VERRTPVRAAAVIMPPDSLVFVITRCRMMMGDAERWCPRRDHSVDESDIRTGRGPYGGPVRWSSLFADLESQLQAAEDQERLAAVPEVTRAERAAVALADRLRGHA